ncbi:MAG: hypothetical protein U0822_08495 [Anaerolineae bacterium]
MQAQDLKIVERIKVRGFFGLDSGWIDITPAETLATRHPEIMPVLFELRKLVDPPGGEEATPLPNIKAMYLRASDEPHAADIEDYLSLWFRCRLVPDQNGPLRGAMRDIGLLEERQTTKSVTLELVYDVVHPMRTRLSSLRLDDISGRSLLQAARLHFSATETAWNFESHYFRPYYWEERSIWPKNIVVNSPGFLPRLSLGNNVLDLDESIDTVPGGKEYRSLALMLSSVNDAIHEFLTQVVQHDAQAMPYPYRNADREKILAAMQGFPRGLQDLRLLVFHLSIDLDNLSGDDFLSRCISLVTYCERRKELPTLAKAILGINADADVWRT